MDIFSFKNNKKYVRLAFLYILLMMLSTVMHRAFEYKLIAAITDILIWALIYYILYRITSERICIGDYQLIAKATVPYMLISEIRASDKIEIISEDGKNGTIKMLDIERNYDSYRELLDKILSKISKEAKDRSGNAEELLEKVMEAKKSVPLKNGKTKLGGLLSFIRVIAIITMIMGLLSSMIFLLSFVWLNTPDTEKDILVSSYVSLAYMFTSSILCAFIIIMLDKRTKKVKYPVAGLFILSAANSIALGLIGILYNSGNNLSLFIGNVTIGIIITIVNIMMGLDYFENSDRAKYTLVN